METDLLWDHVLLYQILQGEVCVCVHIVYIVVFLKAIGTGLGITKGEEDLELKLIAAWYVLYITMKWHGLYRDSFAIWK